MYFIVIEFVLNCNTKSVLKC